MMSGVTESSRSPASPAAERSRSSWWRDPRLAVGVALVAVSVLLGATLVGSGEGGASVWAARAPLVEGQPLASDELVRKTVRFESQADADRYLSAESPLPDGAVLSRDVTRGELLPRAAFGGGESTPTVEVPVVVAPGAVPATLGPGSVVDVWVTPEAGTGPAGPDAALVLSDVDVVGLDRATGGLGAGGDRQVIVAVGPDQEANLPTALGRLARGTVVLVRTS
jgi:hypothetical protein